MWAQNGHGSECKHAAPSAAGVRADMPGESSQQTLPAPYSGPIAYVPPVSVASLPLAGPADAARLSDHLRTIVGHVERWPYEVLVVPSQLKFIDYATHTFVALQIPLHTIVPKQGSDSPEFPILKGHGDLTTGSGDNFVHVSVVWHAHFGSWQARHRACFEARAILGGMVDCPIFVQFERWGAGTSFKLREDCELAVLLATFKERISPYLTQASGPEVFHISWQL